MKKSLFSLALVSAFFAVVSCSKSFDPSEGDQSSETMTFTATIENDDTKTTLGEVDNKKYVNWVPTDKVSINGSIFTVAPKSDPREATLTFESGDTPSAPFKAYYPTALYNDGTPTLPAEQTYNSTNPFSVNPMYAESATSTETLSFKNICAVLAITVNESVSTIEVTSPDKVLNGAFTISNNQAVMSKTENITSVDRKVKLTGCSGTGTFYVAIPASTDDADKYTSLKIIVNGTKTMTKVVNKTLYRSKIYKVTFESTDGLFSVSSTKKVYFSPGNLYCKKESDTWTWHFYDQQYDYLSQTSATSSDTEIDLFTWGYSSDWSTNPITSSYNTGTSSLSVSGGTDWGTVMGTGSGWYTLSSAEWKYLLGFSSSKRTDASSKYGYATVAEKTGIIILPDSFTDPETNGGSNAFKPDPGEYSGAWSDNVYTSGGNWEAMESAGAVFLPTAGYRLGSNVGNAGGYGAYWSSSPNATLSAYNLDFYSYYATVGYYNRIYGFAVRLVRE